jgi:transcriptional regulator with XRE-family HTH domain
MEEIRKNLGARIREVRKRGRLTQKELGQEIGIGISAVSAYEAGDSAVPPEALVIVARLGNVSLDWLITGKEAARPEPKVGEPPTEYVRGKPLSDDEKRFVVMLRRIPEAQKRAVLDKVTGYYIDTMEAVEFGDEEGNDQAHGNG